MFVISAFLLTLVVLIIPSTADAEVVVRLEEVFRDDFNIDDSLNDSKWSTAERHTASISELSYYMEENVGVKNDYLILHCEQEKYMGCNYTGSRVDTNGKYEFLYGEIEWRAKLPGGPEFYTGLWLNKPETNPDLLPFEFAPPSVAFIDSAGIVSQRLFHSYNHMQQVDYDEGIYANIFLAKKPLTFHVYKLIWTDATMEWYVDGHRVFWVYNATKVPQVPLQIVMNIVVGGAFCGGPPGNGTDAFPARQVLVDYVVVRQNVTYVVEEEDQDEEGMDAILDNNWRETMPTYFLPVVGALAILLVIVIVCVLVVVGLRIKARRDRRSFFRVDPLRF